MSQSGGESGVVPLDVHEISAGAPEREAHRVHPADRRRAGDAHALVQRQRLGGRRRRDQRQLHKMKYTVYCPNKSID